jgi:hypothetical protein
MFRRSLGHHHVKNNATNYATVNTTGTITNTKILNLHTSLVDLYNQRTASSSAIPTAGTATKDNFACFPANFTTYTIYVSQNTSVLYLF